MPKRPPNGKSKKKKQRKVPGCHVIADAEAEAFLKDQLLYTTMTEKREREIAEADDAESVMVSIGTTVAYAKQKYIAHIYGIDNFEDENQNGWLIHLWHPRLVWGNHKSYVAYLAKMSDSLGQDLRQIGV